MKALKIIIFILAALFVIYLILCFIGPKKLDTTRSTTIAAPAGIIHDQVVNLKNWEIWSPWNETDTSMQITYGDQTIGVGANNSWTSEVQGNGTLEIIASSMDTIRTKLQFDGWDGYSYGQWTFNESDDGNTEVSWGMTSDSDVPLLVRGMMVVMGMNSALEKNFDDGLASIKGVVEAKYESVKSVNVNATEIPDQSYIVSRSKISIGGISQFYEENMNALATALATAGIEMGGMPCGIYYAWNTHDGTTDLAAAIPVNDEAVVEGYEAISIPGGNAVVADHYGPYNTTAITHWAIDQYLKSNNIEYKGPVIESYLNDPSKVEEDQIHTRVIYYVN